MKLTWTFLVGLAAATSVVATAERGRDRHNLFDSLYEDDESDAHIVSTSSQVASRSMETRRLQPSQRQINVDQLPESNLATRPDLFRSLKPITKTPKREEVHHWSALENYYQKLRHQPKESNPQSAVPNAQIPIYIIPETEDSFDGLRQTKVADGPFISNLDPQRQSVQNPFLLPTIDSPQTEPDFGRSGSVYSQAAPGISRTGGIGGDSILLGTNSNYNRRLNHPQPNLSRSQYVDPILASVGDGKVSYYEWKKLPELIQIQQKQERARHQLDTLGRIYERHRSPEELFCGPRNYVRIHLAPNGSQDITKVPNSQLDHLQFARIQKLLRSDADVAVTLSAGEYPSHIGIYNQTTDSANFLCAGTLVHERFVLTLATCTSGSAAQHLRVRAGEWNLNRTGQDERPMIERQVERIVVFPRDRKNSAEHNLALLVLEKPVEYLDLAYLCPACQMQSRSNMRASSCWTPVRNVTRTEYFDPEGEGETKERQSINMIELPVQLIANDEQECFKRTHSEFFNFQHPNYICSADFRFANWRAQLNRTEFFGSGIYCNEGGNLSLVSILHPIQANSSSAVGYLDLTYYRPWISSIISAN